MSTAGMIQGMKQGMVATPAMQLAMRALQANQTELRELISEALAANPALEEVRDTPLPADAQEIRRRQYLMESLSETRTLADFLEEQIRQSGLAPKILQAALAIIPWLNQHGFFSEPEATVRQELNLSDKLYRQAKQAICDCDPPGVGAADLRESLLLQLERLGEQESLSALLLRQFWDETVRHRYDLIAKALHADEKEVQLAAQRLARLNPDPGSGFSQAELHIITPDITVETEGEELKLTLTRETTPRLALSAEYREMMAEHADKAEVRQYLSRCFREGRELINALQERSTTRLSVAQAIVNAQRQFFLIKGAALAPLKMADIAQATQLHLSTVSRAVRGKYLRCSRGIFELRSFFSTALDDSEISADAVKRQISQLIEEENPQHPLSDAALESMLRKRNLHVARRTIAKYREQLKILPASLRKNR